MAIDPRQLGPTQLCRLLNSTPLGEVISERQLHRHRTRAGFRIGEGRHIDLFRYIAWLLGQRHAPQPDPAGLTGYDAMKEQARARNALLSLSGRDIGELPAVVNPDRKAQAAASFRFFCEVYFPRTFHLAWSPDHMKVIAKIEEAVLHGGLFALAMPRGSGKTTIAECACLWAILFGHREFVALIGASEVHAEEMLDSIKMELDGNEALLDDFPEAVFPHWHLYENGKLATKDPLRYPPACAEIIRRLLCLPVSELLGIDGTFGDWHCHGSGLHAMPPGSSLGVHLDSDHHPATNWRRAANAVLYVNRHWVSDQAASDAPMSNPSLHGHKPPSAGWGGEFELWNADGRYCLQRIEPRFNRLVLFEPSDVAWHAVAPVRGPETRKTLTVFFWKHGGLSPSKRSRAAFIGGTCSQGGM